MRGDTFTEQDARDAVSLLARIHGEPGGFDAEELPLMPPGRLPRRKQVWTAHLDAPVVNGEKPLTLSEHMVWEWEPVPDVQQSKSERSYAAVYGTDREAVLAGAMARLHELKQAAAERKLAQGAARARELAEISEVAQAVLDRQVARRTP